MGLKKRNDGKSRRSFWFSLAISLFLFLTAAGCLVVDYQGRRLSFGDPDPVVRIERKLKGQALLEIKAFGRETAVDVTEIDKFLDFLCDFGCIPHK